MGTTPTHGFCIKVRAPSGVHYVNVCSHAAVGLPQDAREREIPEAHLRERGARPTGEAVTVSGPVVTGRGPEDAKAFAAALVARLSG